MTVRNHESVPQSRHAVVAAGGFAGLVLLVIVFQLALAAGAPWGRLTLGGAFPGQLPRGMRVAAFVQALVLLLFIAIIAARARLMLPRWHAASRYLVWVVIAYTAAGTVLNAITPSTWERVLWLPVVLAMGVCAIVVARNRVADRTCSGRPVDRE